MPRICQKRSSSAPSVPIASGEENISVCRTEKPRSITWSTAANAKIESCQPPANGIPLNRPHEHRQYEDRTCSKQGMVFDTQDDLATCSRLLSPIYEIQTPKRNTFSFERTHAVTPDRVTPGNIENTTSADPEPGVPTLGPLTPSTPFKDQHKRTYSLCSSPSSTRSNSPLTPKKLVEQAHSKRKATTEIDSVHVTQGIDHSQALSLSSRYSRDTDGERPRFLTNGLLEACDRLQSVQAGITEAAQVETQRWLQDDEQPQSSAPCGTDSGERRPLLASHQRSHLSLRSLFHTKSHSSMRRRLSKLKRRSMLSLFSGRHEISQGLDRPTSVGDTKLGLDGTCDTPTVPLTPRVLAVPETDGLRPRPSPTSSFRQTLRPRSFRGQGLWKAGSSASTLENASTCHQVPTERALSADAPTPNIADPVSLEDYEKTLSAQGDDRRRKSVTAKPAVTEEAKERGGSMAKSIQSLKSLKALRRATPINFDNRSRDQVIMTNALARHRKEKAAMKLSGAARLRERQSTRTLPEARPVTDQQPTEMPSMTFQSSFGPATSPSRVMTRMDDVDPLDATTMSASVRRTQSMVERIPRQDPPHTRTSKVDSLESKTTTQTIDRLSKPPASWSRYPSETRRLRNQHAGSHNNVIARDFAYEPKALLDTAQRAKTRKTSKWSYHAHINVVKQIWRYYATLFTTSSAQNRRSSLTTGGKLEHPELEMLPPIFSPHSYMDSVGDRAKQHLSHAAEQLRTEAHELHEFVEHLNPHHKDSAGSQIDQQHTPTNVCKSREHLGLMLDGTNDDDEELGSAMRLSEMYQQLCGPLVFSRPGSALSVGDRVPETIVEETSVPSTGGVKHDMEPGSPVDSHTGWQSPDAAKFGEGEPVELATKDNAWKKVIAVRHFPSVTVVDDRQGHWRSISLLSKKSTRSGSSEGSRAQTRQVSSSSRVTDLSDGASGASQGSRIGLLGSSGLLDALDAVEAEEREKVVREQERRAQMV